MAPKTSITLLLVSFLALLASHSVAQTAKFVRYSDFGAIGDGKIDDLEALIAAHEHANKNGLMVKADDNVSYYIGGAAKSIPVMTSTDFGSAHFIIDDTNLDSHSKDVFEIKSQTKTIILSDIKTLTKGQKKLEVNLASPCIITAIDSEVMRFKRRGPNRNKGRAQKDVFLVDQQGKIDAETPIVWGFDQLTSLEAKPIEKEKLTIKGGIFTTIASNKKSSKYHARGFGITRSNVLIENLQHKITGEGKEGPPYRGFISISGCARVMLRDCVLSGHKTYSKIGSAGSRVAMGSYDINLNSALRISLIRCSQFTDINDRSRWGIMGTNFCKRVFLDECKLSRFDAHMGVTNATIRNSTLGYMGIKLTGFGTFLADNTTVHASDFITLRPDYGSTWDGDIIIRNCRFIPPPNKSSIVVINGNNDGTHDFGYPTSLPSRVLIDRFYVDDSKVKDSYKGLAIFGNMNRRLKDPTSEVPFPQSLPQKVIYRNIKTESGKEPRISDNSYMFRNVEVSHQ